MNCETTDSLSASPFLRWAGSKKQLIPELLPYWNKSNHYRYIEPFLGAAHLFFSISPAKAILSDINPDLILTYNVIKDNPQELSSILNEMPVSKDYYYSLRKIKPSEFSPVKRAARFIYLNRYCFNGLYRTNLEGQFNVPYGPTKTGKIPTIDTLILISESLKKCNIVCKDFEEVIILNSQKDDLIYLDPPYISNQRIFSSYNGKIFTHNDYNRLTNLLDYIDKTGASFMLSSLYEKETLYKLKKWNIKIVSTKRVISSLTTSRSLVQELIISNF